MGWMIVVMGRFESASPVMDLVTLGLALGTMFGPGRYITEKAFQSLRRGIFNQHVLLEAGAFAGLLGGLLGLFVFPSFPTVHFFAVSVFITTYHILSEYTSLIVRTRASQAVQSLLDLQPDTARRVTDDGNVEDVPVDDIAVGDQVRVKPGENVPVDGVVGGGKSTVDESVATGESIPEEKTEGDEVIGGSVNETGTLLVEVTAIGDDAFLNQVAREIEEARAMKPGIIQLADRVLKLLRPGRADYRCALVNLLAGRTAGVGWWAERPARRVRSTSRPRPRVSLRVGDGDAACAHPRRRQGRQSRHPDALGDAFQIFPDIDHIVLDKTGTITVGEPVVSEIVGVGEGRPTCWRRQQVQRPSRNTRWPTPSSTTPTTAASSTPTPNPSTL